MPCEKAYFQVKITRYEKGAPWGAMEFSNRAEFKQYNFADRCFDLI